MTDLKAIVDEMTATLGAEGKGADKERDRIVWYLRREAEKSGESDDPFGLGQLANEIEAGFHWDMTEEEEAALDAEIEADNSAAAGGGE